MELQRSDLWKDPDEFHGRSWKRCYQKHQRVRQVMEQKHGMIIPCCSEFVVTRPRWAHTLTPRAWDLVAMHLFVTKHAHGLGVGDLELQTRKYIWDTSNNVDYERKKHPNSCGVAPCFLLSHDYWLTWRERPITGIEVLLTQGFPSTMVTSWCPSDDAQKMGNERDKLLLKLELPGHRLSDKRLRMLGGNTQSVPIMGILLGVILANVQWNPDESDQAVGL